MIAELNHRVRNILSLVRGLVAQSKDSTASAEEFASVLGGRIQALARAHDQITNLNWAPAALKSLVESEAGAYLGSRAGRIRLVRPRCRARSEGIRDARPRRPRDDDQLGEIRRARRIRPGRSRWCGGSTRVRASSSTGRKAAARRCSLRRGAGSAPPSSSVRSRSISTATPNCASTCWACRRAS